MSDATGLQALVKSGVVNFGLASDDYATYRPGFPPRFFEKIAKAITEYRAVSAANSVAKTASAEDKAAAAKVAAAAAAAADAKGAAAAAGAAGAGAAAAGGGATGTGAGAAWDWAGKHVLDLGTGPGIVALECAARGATVVGVDIAANQIAAAVKRAKALGLEAVSSFHVGTAEQTGQPSGAFDIVLAGQCWPWFKPAEAMPEIKRVLKPGGVFVIGQFCYLPHRSPLAHDTEQLILAMNPAWSMHGFDGLYPKQVDTLVVGGKFELIEQFSFDHAQPFTHAGWRGRIRTCNGVGSGGMTEADVAVFDQRLAKLMAEKYPAEPQNVWHRVWGVIVHA